MRRTGKSTLLKLIKQELLERGIKEEQIIFINKELFEFDFVRNAEDLGSRTVNMTCQ